jgi:hypothetical protein
MRPELTRLSLRRLVAEGDPVQTIHILGFTRGQLYSV